MKAITFSIVKISESLRVVSEAFKKVSQEIESHAKSQKKESAKTPLKKNALSKKPIAKKKTAPAKKTTTRKAKPAKVSAAATVLDIIKGADNGIGMAILKEKTGFNDRKIANCIYRLKKQGMIKTTGRGIYTSL